MEQQGGYRITEQHALAKQEAFNAAIFHMAGNPAIYELCRDRKPIKRGQSFPAFIDTAIIDLDEAIPDIEQLQIAQLLSVDPRTVRRALNKEYEQDFESNEMASGSLLAALKREHPGREGEIDPRSESEYVNQGLPWRGSTIRVVLP